MTRFATLAFCFVGSFSTAFAVAFAHEPPKIEASACAKAPKIDGRVEETEWAAATSHDFEMSFLSVVPPKVAPARMGWLKVMNSANGLYVAMKIPDETYNQSLTPFDLDFAMLAFCQGDDIAAGDDRKAVAVGVYLDKHVTAPGKDADDAASHGSGAAFYDKERKAYTYEWAVPLNASDEQDVRLKPGDRVRFNLAVFDAFRLDLKGTSAGAAFGGDLNKIAGWPTLVLATDVVDDGGEVFEGPQWVRELLAASPLAKLRKVEVLGVESLADAKAAKATLGYECRRPEGGVRTASAKVYLPEAAREQGASLPLFYNAGYELGDAAALAQVALGRIVVTPNSLEANPLVRTSNPDAALLHFARSLPCIDDAKVTIAGGSAGGYMTLMLAAETFPLAAAAPDVPPVNWGYNCAFFLQRKQAKDRGEGDAPQFQTPIYDQIIPVAEQARDYYGPDLDDPIWFRHSPVAQLDTITCPVSVCWTTADMLVPIDQVSQMWVRPFDPAKYPPGFTMTPSDLQESADGQKRLLDELSTEEFEHFAVDAKTIEEWAARVASGKPAAELPFSESRPWSIVIFDEDRPEPAVGHFKNAILFSRANYFEWALGRPIAVEQLTEAKLARLMDRYRCVEWLPTKFTHLDEPEIERSDVIRGLMTYVRQGESHAQRFNDLYKALPEERQALPPKALIDIRGKP